MPGGWLGVPAIKTNFLGADGVVTAGVVAARAWEPRATVAAEVTKKSRRLKFISQSPVADEDCH
jgi:hypothetical protein